MRSVRMPGNLFIQVDVGAAHQRYAQAINKDAGSLTEQERAQAVLDAYLSVDPKVIQPWNDEPL